MTTVCREFQCKACVTEVTPRDILLRRQVFTAIDWTQWSVPVLGLERAEEFNEEDLSAWCKTNLVRPQEGEVINPVIRV